MLDRTHAPLPPPVLVLLALIATLLTPAALAINIPEQVSPINDAMDIGLQPTLKWKRLSNATYYQWRLSIKTGDNAWTTVISADSPQARVNQPAGSPTNVSVEIPIVLNVSTSYRWAVRAINENASNPDNRVGEFSNLEKFTTKPPLPPPAIVSPTEGTPNISVQPLLVWGSVDSAVRYEVDVDGPGMPGTPVDFGNVTSIRITPANFGANLEDGSVAYTWRVRAMGNKRYGNWSARINFTTVPKIPAPTLLDPAPDERVGLAPNLTWAQVGDETNYEVRILDTNDNVLGIQDVTGTTTRIDSNNFPAMPRIEPWFTRVLLEDTEYKWRVRVKKTNRLGIRSERRSFITRPGIQPPSVVEPLNGEINVSVYPLLRWNQLEDDPGYNIELRGVDDPGFFEEFSKGATGEHQVQTQLVGNARYQWRIRGRDPFRTGDWTAWLTFTIRTPIPAPTNIRPATDAVVNTRPVFEWQPVPNRLIHNVNDYRIEVQILDRTTGLPVPGGSMKFKSMTITGDIDDTSIRPLERNRLDTGTLYRWRVQGTHVFHELGDEFETRDGLWSDWTTFTTIGPITAMRGEFINEFDPSTASKRSFDFAANLGPTTPFEPIVWGTGKTFVTASQTQVFTETDTVTRVEFTLVEGSGDWEFKDSFLTLYDPGEYRFSVVGYDSEDRPTGPPVPYIVHADRLTPKVTWPSLPSTTYSGIPASPALWDAQPTAGWTDATGDPPQELPVAGAFSFGSNPTHPDTHDVRATFSPDDNDRFRSVSKIITLTITPAPLTITADDKFRLLTRPDPPFTATATGLVNGETLPALTYSTAPEPGTQNLRIIPSGFDSTNYDITFIPGTLTVLNAADDPRLIWGSTPKILWPDSSLTLYYSHNLIDWFPVQTSEINSSDGVGLYDPGSTGGTYFQLRD